MSRRRYIGGTYGLLPTGINDLRTWKSWRNDTLLDITYRDNKSDVFFKRIIGQSDCLYKEVHVKPNKLYKLVFSYEVKKNYELRWAGNWFGLGVFKDLQEAWSGVGANKVGAEAYCSFGFSPEQRTTTLYFIPKTESVIFYLGLFQVKDNGAQFVIGDFSMTEEELPTIIEDDAQRDVHIITSGVAGILEVTHTDNRKENITLPVGLNTISLPAEVQKISFAGARNSDEKNAILWADLGNVKIRDASSIFSECYHLYKCYGVNLTASRDIAYTFSSCESLEIIGKLDIINIISVTWVSFMCRKLKSVRIQNLGAKLKILDLEPCDKLSIESIEYMVDNSAVPMGGQCDVILNERLLNRIPEELKNKAKERRVILRQR